MVSSGQGSVGNDAVSLLTLRLDAEVAANFGEGHLDRPASDEPGEHVGGIGIGVGGQECLCPELSGGITQDKPAQAALWASQDGSTPRRRSRFRSAVRRGRTSR